MNWVTSLERVGAEGGQMRDLERKTKRTLEFSQKVTGGNLPGGRGYSVWELVRCTAREK